MSAISQRPAQGLGLRPQLTTVSGAVQGFARAMFAAHGGWHPAQPQRSASPASARVLRRNAARSAA